MNRIRTQCRRGSLAFIAVALVATACASAGGRPDVTANVGGGPDDIVAQVASYDLVVGRPGRFIVGLFAADKSRLVAFGAVELTFSFLGDRSSAKSSGKPGAPVAAGFLPIPGQRIDPAAPGPRLVQGSEATGVYGATDVRFDRPGFWRVNVDTVIGGRRRQADAAFEVMARSAIPAIGDLAPRTEHPVAGAAGSEPRSIDSRAAGDSPIPDPELHSTTIAAALAAGRPLVVVVSTPIYCTSRFCGPITDSVSNLAKRYGDRAAFVHLEVWKNFEAMELNRAAAEWINPPGSEDAREPWVFVVGRDGRIAYRFDNVTAEAELEAALAEVTR